MTYLGNSKQQLGQEAGGEDHKEVVVKSQSLKWLTQDMQERVMKDV